MGTFPTGPEGESELAADSVRIHDWRIFWTIPAWDGRRGRPESPASHQGTPASEGRHSADDRCRPSRRFAGAAAFHARSRAGSLPVAFANACCQRIALSLVRLFGRGPVVFIGASLFLARPGVAEKLPAGIPGREALLEIASAYRLFARSWRESLLAILLSIPFFLPSSAHFIAHQRHFTLTSR